MRLLLTLFPSNKQPNYLSRVRFSVACCVSFPSTAAFIQRGCIICHVIYAVAVVAFSVLESRVYKEIGKEGFSSVNYDAYFACYFV